MHMLTRRLQVLLDERQYTRLEGYARERGLSVGAAVRDAIERVVPAADSERAAAARRILSAAPMAVPDPDTLRREIEDLRSRRA